jgi:hypothetical protein
VNATNNRILMRAYGRNSDDWVGKEIELYLGEIEFQGTPVGCGGLSAPSPLLLKDNATAFCSGLHAVPEKPSVTVTPMRVSLLKRCSKLHCTLA